MNANVYKKRLKKSQSVYEQGKKEAEDFFSVKPEGEYTLQLSNIAIDDINTKNGNCLVAKVKYKIIESDHDNIGQTVTDTLFLEGNEQTPMYVTLWFKRHGYEEPDNYEDLPEVFEEIIEDAPEYNANILVTDDGNYNKIRIQNVVDENETKAEDPDDSEAEDPDKWDSMKDLDKFKTIADAFGVEDKIKTARGAITIFKKYEWDYEQLEKYESEFLSSKGIEVVGMPQKTKKRVRKK